MQMCHCFHVVDVCVMFVINQLDLNIHMVTVEYKAEFQYKAIHGTSVGNCSWYLHEYTTCGSVILVTQKCVQCIYFNEYSLCLCFLKRRARVQIVFGMLC